MAPETFSPEDSKALNEIRRILQEHRESNWTMPEKHAMFAQDIAHDLPAQAYTRVDAYIKNMREHNLKQRQRFEQAQKFKQDIKNDVIPEITNAGQRGIIGYFWRSFLATTNATPLSSLNFFEITEDGLLVEQPFVTVSRRVFKFKELANNEITMSVNPPAYLDWLLGFLRQFFRKITSPWGEIVIYERGSGREIARAVALWPEQKIKVFRGALETLHLAENQFAGREREPKKIDLLSYYDVEYWTEVDKTHTVPDNNAPPPEEVQVGIADDQETTVDGDK